MNVQKMKQRRAERRRFRVRKDIYGYDAYAWALYQSGDFAAASRL